MCSMNLRPLHLPLLPSKPSSSSIASLTPLRSARSQLNVQTPKLRTSFSPIAAMDDDFMDAPIFSDEGDNDSSFYATYSSGDESDFDMVINPIGDADLPPSSKEYSDTPEAALTVTAHRFATIQRDHRKKRSQPGFMINMGLITFFILFLSFADWHAWKIVRLPLEAFFLTRPFSISTVLSVCAGCLFVPIADSMRIHQMRRKRGPIRRYLKWKVPTMGGLFFVPIGIIVARSITGTNSNSVKGAAVATLAFATIGLSDDVIKISTNHSYRIPGWVKFFMQVGAGAWFSFWLYTTNAPTPYSMYSSQNQSDQRF